MGLAGLAKGTAKLKVSQFNLINRMSFCSAVRVAEEFKPELRLSCQDIALIRTRRAGSRRVSRPGIESCETKGFIESTSLLEVHEHLGLSSRARHRNK